MRWKHLRQADLNLLVLFAVLVEERNVSRAAERLRLSQPAVTRAMQRLRDSFKDELLIRISGDYELTPKGEALKHELEGILPRLENLLTGGAFDPARENASFRIAGTDYAAYVLGLPLMGRFLTFAKKVSFEMLPLRDDVFDWLERGRLDLLLHAEDGRIPLGLRKQQLFEDHFVCVVSADSPLQKRISRRDYMRARHVGVVTGGGTQTIPEQLLSSLGLKREMAFRFPYFDLALRAVAGTDLIATVPSRFVKLQQRLEACRVIAAPDFFGPFQYVMVWHPRLDDDPAQRWLRKELELLGKTSRR